MSRELEFSIILPVCHGGRFLKDALSSIRKVDYSPEMFEVIVAGLNGDEESKGITDAEASRSQFDVKYVGCNEANRSRMLNAACANARGRVLAFADDDCVFRNDWLMKLRDVFEREPDLGIVGGQEVLEHAGSDFDIALDCVLNSYIGTGGVRKGSGLRMGKYYPKLWNMAVPRDAAFSVALKAEEGRPQVFNESLDLYGDVDLADRIERMGKRIVFAPEVRIGHARDTTFLSFAGRNFSMARTCRSLGVHRLPHMALALFAAGMPALAVASVFAPPLVYLLFLVVGLYGAALLSVAVRSFLRTKRPGVIVLIPVLLVSLHLARGTGYMFPMHNGGRT
jgi:GT2 family glycosyltransferase